MFDANRVDWVHQRQQLVPRTLPFIHGEWLRGSGDALTLTSPRDGSVLAEVSGASAEDVDAAVRSARLAFDSGVWSALAPRERGQRLLEFAQLIHDRAEELALLISLEMGKPLREAFQIELRAVVNCFRWYGEAADKLIDEAPVTSPDALALVSREPVGVVAAVVPWNFPLTMAAWKLGPALAAGNSVVLKPAEHTSCSALRLGELAFEAGIPAGVLNVIPGHGLVAGRALGEHPDVDVITFTGSTGVGRELLEYSARSNGKRVWLELGGKTASVVLEDADFDAAVRATAEGCFFNQGEMCTSASRLIVPRAMVDRAAEIAARVAAEMRPADPLELDAPIGPLVSSAHLERVRGFVERARESGTRILGAQGLEHCDPAGAYFAPVVAVVEPDHELAQREVFGPVLAVIPYDSEDDAISIANGTEYGLAAVLWTEDLNRAHRLSRRIRAGVVWVNCFEEGDMTVPFGGVKGSGFGRDKSLHAIEKFTDLKTTWIQLS